MKFKCIAAIILIVFQITVTYSQNWKNYLDTAEGYSLRKMPDSASIYYAKARYLLPADSLGSETAFSLNKNLAKSYLNSRQLEKVDSFTIQVRNLARERSAFKTVAYANWNDEMGILYYNADEYQKAEGFFTEAKQIREQLLSKEHADYAKSCHLVATVNNSMGDYERAESLFLEARAIRERLFTRESPEYAQTCNNLGDVYRNIGDYDKAEQLTLEAKEIRAKIPGRRSPAYAISCTALANVYKDIGQYEKAESLYLEARKVRLDTLGANHQLYAASCNILADLYYYMKRYGDAEKLYIEAKNLREKISGKNSYTYAQSCNNLSALYRETGRYQEAEVLALEAKEIYSLVLPKGHNTFPINFNNLGDLYFEMRQFQKARDYYQQAKTLWEASLGKDHTYYGVALRNLAKVNWNLGEINEAKSLYETAASSRYKELKKIFQFTNEVQKESYLKNISSSADEYLSFYFQKIPHNAADASYAISLANRNLILTSSQQLRSAIFRSADSATIKLYNDWSKIKERLARMVTNPLTDEKVKADLVDRANNIEQQLTRLSAEFRNSQKSRDISWTDVQKGLGPAEAAIEFIEFNLFNGTTWTDSIYYAGLVLRNDREKPHLIYLFEKTQLDSLIRHASRGSRAMYMRGDDGEGSTISTRLFNLIWKPLESQLSGIRRIYFAPVGLLHRISFTAIPVHNNQLLGERYELHQLSTTATVINSRPEFLKSSEKIHLYGGIVYDGDSTELKKLSGVHQISRSFSSEPGKAGKWDYLDGTQLEINTIKELADGKKYQINVRSGLDANEESIKALQGNLSPSILHIATHGFFFPDPTEKTKKEHQTSSVGNIYSLSDNPLFRSGLLFAGANYAWLGEPIQNIEDGILTAYEVSNIYLPNTKLVVLSACETALGDIQGSEGVYGLQRSFKMAGVQNLIMSLWKVPDVETAEFMQIFYRHLFEGTAIDKSFYAAQAVMKKNDKGNAYKWAAWVLIQ